MRNLFLLAVISLAVVANSGCSSKLMSFEKRKYNQGYHIDFAQKKGRKAKAVTAENAVVIPSAENKEIEQTASAENTYATAHEIKTEETIIPETNTENAAATASAENKKIAQPRLFKEKFSATAKRSLEKIIPKRNTVATADFNIFTWAGAVIGGGGLIALAVMLFSNWATVTLLILLVSACFLGFILLIVGANT